MAGVRHRFLWLVVVAAYWFCALLLLFQISPIYDDGYGLSASFFWGSHPPRSYPQLLYPYWVAASIITCLGCGLTKWLVRIWRLRRSHLFVISSAITLCSLLLVGAISDIGIALHFWFGPTVFGGFSSLWPFLKEFVPMSLLAGTVALIGNRLSA